MTFAGKTEKREIFLRKAAGIIFNNDLFAAY
jgi:hypothetical protein